MKSWAAAGGGGHRVRKWSLIGLKVGQGRGIEFHHYLDVKEKNCG